MAKDAKRPKFVDQSAKDLKLMVVRGFIDPSQFGVFGQKTLSAAGVTVTASVIGASHCLNVRTENGTVTELFACLDFRCRERHFLVKPWDYPEGYAHAAADFAPIDSYLFRPRLKTFSEGATEADRIVSLAEAAGGRNSVEIGIACRFPPDPEKQDCPSPRTAVLVRWQPESRVLTAETVHEYPNEGLVAFSATKIRLQGRT